jgi:hypothetical protein
LLFLAAALAAGTALAGAAPPAPPASPLAHVGRTFLFDYGDLVIRVRYLSPSRLQWTQVKGPQAGLQAEEEYGHSVVRSDVVFFWWQEKDSSVVTQVVDFGKGAVHTTWTSAEKKLGGFQGKVKAAE